MRFICDFLHCNRPCVLVSSGIHVQIVELCGSGHRQYSRIWLQIKACDPKVIGLFGFRYLIPGHKVRICSAQISFYGRFYVIANVCHPWWLAVAKISTSGRDWGCCQFVLQLPGPRWCPPNPFGHRSCLQSYCHTKPNSKQVFLPRSPSGSKAAMAAYDHGVRCSRSIHFWNTSETNKWRKQSSSSHLQILGQRIWGPVAALTAIHHPEYALQSKNMGQVGTSMQL